VEQVQRRIINGTPDTRPEHNAVVALTWGPGDDNFCSGTLIAPDVVATAAHCLDAVSPSVLHVFFGNDVSQSQGQVGVHVGAAEVMPHPLYEGEPRFEYDIGLVRLDGAAPVDATPIPILPAGMDLTATDEGTPVEFVGFGQTEYGTSGVKLSFLGEIVSVCDGPEPCAYGGGGTVAPRAIGYSVQGGGPCSGDSGGPALVTRYGQEYVAAVTSYGDEGCDYYGVSTRTDRYRGWIEAFIQGISEDCGGAGDEDRDGLGDCADPDCDDSEDCPEAACRAPEVLRCGDRVEATTVGGSYQMRRYTCAGNDVAPERGPERAYRVDAPAGLDVTVHVTMDGTGDLDLFLLPTFGPDCATWDCLDVSAEAGDTAESLTFGMDDDVRVVVDTWDHPAPYTIELQCHTRAERCDNGIDDDADGALDCEDPDCAQAGPCLPPPENCINGVDDDLDGKVDCDDPDCAESRLCDNGGGSDGGCHQSRGDNGPGPGLAGLVLLLLWKERRRQRR